MRDLKWYERIDMQDIMDNTGELAMTLVALAVSILAVIGALAGSWYMIRHCF